MSEFVVMVNGESRERLYEKSLVMDGDSKLKE